jgi:hypothetical protein
MKNALVVVGLMFLGCGVSQTELESDELLNEDGSELSTTARTYVTFTRDFRKCMAPMCGGYFVSDVNRVNPSRTYVSDLDFSASGLDEATIAKALEGDATILRGKLGKAEAQFHTRKFVVSDAWRGMPGVTAAATDSIYKVEASNIFCIRAPCASLKATRLNASGLNLFDGTDVAPAALSFVDQKWLTNRVTDHQALVAGKAVNGTLVSGTYERILSASQVFVKLPEAPGPCPLAKMPPCATGKVRSFVRNEDRCELPSACVTPMVCTQFIPACPAGYTMQYWKGASACWDFACDPAFSL